VPPSAIPLRTPWRFNRTALGCNRTSALAQSKKAMARKDLERILAEDSSYEGVREQLAELSA
jgi:hypothetical protein